MYKKSILVLAVGLILSMMGCTNEVIGPEGPPGRDGRDGIDGETAFVFEYEVDFTAPEYRAFLEFPGDFQMLESDVALVYFLWEIDNGVEVWRPLPLSLFLQEGLLNYSFDFTLFDVSVFMDSSFPLNLLGADFTDDWVVRVVVVPGLFGTNGRVKSPVDYDDYNAVRAYYNLAPTALASDGYKKVLE